MTRNRWFSCWIPEHTVVVTQALARLRLVRPLLFRWPRPYGEHASSVCASPTFLDRARACSGKRLVAVIWIGIGWVWAFGAAVGAARAETVVERSINVEILADGSLRESTHLVVRVDDQDDVSSWSTYRLFLDANRHVSELDVRIRAVGGGIRTVGEDEREEVARRVGGVLYGSQRDLLVHLAPLEPGELLDIRHTVAFSPYFPASRVNLRGLGGIEKLTVRVSGAGEHWRWRLEGQTAGLRVNEIAGGIEIRGEGLERIVLPPLAIDEAAGAVLRFAWGPATGWRDIGVWYRELMRDLPGPSPAVTESALGALAEAATPREKLDRLIRFLEEKIRYVAVSVGEGNVRPSPADETLRRQWGDCKDKTLLLIEMLEVAGIEAFPALVRFDSNGRIDGDFPSPMEFNHVIAALPIQALDVARDDPVADGFLFVDTTQQRFAGRWLAPALQGQDALVIDATGGRLIRTPLLVAQERRELAVDLEVDAEGNAQGTLLLSLSGEPAYQARAWLQRLSSEEARTEAAGLLASLLPGATLDQAAITVIAATLPRVSIHARVRLPTLVQRMDSASPSFQLPGMRVAPAPADLADGDVGRVVPATTAVSRWRLSLPADRRCTGRTLDVEIDLPLGRFSQRVSVSSDGRVMIERSAELRRRFVDAEELDALGAIALAEHRAHRRRIRLDCAPHAADAL